MRFQPQCYHQAFLSQFDCRSRKPSKLRELSSHPTMITLDESSYALSDLYAPTFTLGYLIKKVNTLVWYNQCSWIKNSWSLQSKTVRSHTVSLKITPAEGGVWVWSRDTCRWQFFVLQESQQDVCHRSCHVVEFASRRRKKPSAPTNTFFCGGRSPLPL